MPTLATQATRKTNLHKLDVCIKVSNMLADMASPGGPVVVFRTIVALMESAEQWERTQGPISRLWTGTTRQEALLDLVDDTRTPVVASTLWKCSNPAAAAVSDHTFHKNNKNSNNKNNNNKNSNNKNSNNKNSNNKNSNNKNSNNKNSNNKNSNNKNSNNKNNKNT
ncbi:hypothetical protein AYO21_11509 [Fonsecaea monophora]|uniref:Uncharacterized protein n=1 Tax=Fonsecaea monophora TaxID=254056 RepID=A0A177ETL2_9EURO|nr:hypothetical protein AYO21_11509 [Fonsecaea monophora]OAG34329.1 hypothetical protein AYO21_11509 [Fonsecaea monophora]